MYANENIHAGYRETAMAPAYWFTVLNSEFLYVSSFTNPTGSFIHGTTPPYPRTKPLPQRRPPNILPAPSTVTLSVISSSHQNYKTPRSRKRFPSLFSSPLPLVLLDNHKPRNIPENSKRQEKPLFPEKTRKTRKTPFLRKTPSLSLSVENPISFSNGRRFVSEAEAPFLDLLLLLLSPRPTRGRRTRWAAEIHPRLLVMASIESSGAAGAERQGPESDLSDRKKPEAIQRLPVRSFELRSQLRRGIRRGARGRVTIQEFLVSVAPVSSYSCSQDLSRDHL